MRSQLKVLLMTLLRLIPITFRKRLVFAASKSLRQADGSINDIDVFDFSILQELCGITEYLTLYRRSQKLAGDQAKDNVYKTLRYISLYSYIEDVLNRDIAGDFAECGCYNGNTLFATKYLLDKYKSDKSMHIFDSFEGGLSKLNKEDGIRSISEQKQIELRESFASSYSALIKKTINLKRVNINKGWIPDILNNEQERKYAFVHIDVDLYEPTLAAHRYFYERLNKGGIIVCDDYGYSQFPGAKTAVDTFIEKLPEKSYSNFFRPSIGTSVIIK